MDKDLWKTEGFPAPSAILAFFLIIGLVGCGSTVSVQRVTFPGGAARSEPSVPHESPERLLAWAGKDSVRLTQAAEAILNRRSGKSMDWRSGDALVAAYFAQNALVNSGMPAARWIADPRCEAALAVSRRALTLFIQENKPEILQAAGSQLPSSLGRMAVSVKWDARPFPSDYFDRLIPAETVGVRGFRSRITVPGLGVPLVGIRSRRFLKEPEMDRYPPAGVSIPLNATVQFSGFSDGFLRAEIRLTNSREVSAIRIGAQRVPLAVDYTAPLAFSFKGPNDLLLGIRNFFNVGLGTGQAGVYLTEPPDSRRIPVLLIHGLSSSPIVWRNVVNEAMRDPVIRDRFQFWYAYYSTGAPLVYSASQIREDLFDLRAKHPDSRISKDLVIVGYSMGGVMARMLITDIGDHLWNAISEVPIQQVRLDPDDAQVIRQSLFWKPVRRIDQVIFIATPHRGTHVADASFAHLAGWLVRLPRDFVRFQRRFFDALEDALGGHAAIKSRLTGLDDLSWRAPLYQALAEAPMDKRAQLHSVIGDRGRGDTPDSSDGIVGYWSSHLAQAESELIVPTGHNAQASPLTEREIYRILDADWREVRGSE